MNRTTTPVCRPFLFQALRHTMLCPFPEFDVCRRCNKAESIAVATTYHSAKEGGVDGAQLGVDLGWIHLVDIVSGVKGECR